MVGTQTEEDLLLRRVGQNIGARRRALGLTQAQLAERLGVDTETLSRFERGKHAPTLKNLAKLASLLETTVADLLAEEQPAPIDDAAVMTAWLSPLLPEDRAFVMAQLKQSCDYLGRGRKSPTGDAGGKEVARTEIPQEPTSQPTALQEPRRRIIPKSGLTVAKVFELADLPEKLDALFGCLDAGQLVGLGQAGKVVSRIRTETVYVLYERKPELRDQVLARYPKAEKQRKADRKEELRELKVKPLKLTPPKAKGKADAEKGAKLSSEPWIVTMEKVDDPYADGDPDTPE